jgi:hypothetical protein
MAQRGADMTLFMPESACSVLSLIHDTMPPREPNDDDDEDEEEDDDEDDDREAALIREPDE